MQECFILTYSLMRCLPRYLVYSQYLRFEEMNVETSDYLSLNMRAIPLLLRLYSALGAGGWQLVSYDAYEMLES